MILEAQTKWRWLIAVYLFLAGLGAGAYAVGAAAGLLGRPAWLPIAKIGVSLGFPCVLIGSMFLIADLGSPGNFWRAAMRPRTAWIARGTIIITIFMILSAIHLGFWVWPFDSLADAAGARNLVSVLGIIFAFGTMIYTGLLLGAARPIAFWSTAMLPLLFLVSALSTGMMTIILISSIMGVDSGRPFMLLARADFMLVVLEIFVLAFYLQATHRVPESRASAQAVVRGEVAPLFWIGVGIVGLLIPLIVGGYGVVNGHGDGLATSAAVAAVCGVIGGLCLRQVVLAGGIHAPLKAGRFEYVLPPV